MDGNPPSQPKEKRTKSEHVALLRELTNQASSEGRRQFTTFQERSSLYDDVRSLLSPGFIAKSVQINGVGIGLRTLNYDDLLLVEGRTGLGKEDWVDWVLASSIWVVGGQMIQKDQEAILFLFEKVRRMPLTIKHPLLTALSILNTRFNRCRDRALSYFYERESRDLWRSRGLTLFTGEFSWVGRNAIQDLWAFYNRMEDDRTQRIFEQNMAGFQVSPHAPESIKKMTSRAKRDEEQLERDRGVVQDKMFFNAYGVEFDSSRYRKFGIDEIQKAETFEDLERQMKDAAAGKKDEHDLVVERIQKRVKTERQFRKWKADKLRRESEQRAVQAREQGDTRTSVVLVGAEADRMLADFAREAARPQKTREHENSEIYDKYLGNNDDVKQLTLDEYGQVVNEIPAEMRDFFNQEITANLKNPAKP